MPIELITPKTTLTPESEKRVRRDLDGLERRLSSLPHPIATLTLRDRSSERRFTADLILQTGVDSADLVAHQAAPTAEAAAKLAVEDIERQLEKYMATLRGDASFGTPSRREPKTLRPATAAVVEDDEDDYDAPPISI